jgi:hypothetical protein
MIAVNDFSIKWVRVITNYFAGRCHDYQKGRLFTRPFWYHHR